MNNHNHFNGHIKSRSEYSPLSASGPPSDDESFLNRHLPKELLLRIFSFLDVVTLCRCAQVAKYWNMLALDGSNWQRVDLFDFQTDVEGPVVENISKRCGGFLKSLSLRGCQSVTDAALRTFAQSCQNIETLILSGCKKITDTTCLSLGKYCRKLMHLDLSSCPSVTSQSLKSISDGCPNLDHINISWCQVADNGVEALARGCPKLQIFVAKGCSQLTDEGISDLAKYCQELKTLNLHSCGNVTDDAIHHVCNSCHCLQSLCVSGCPHITDATLASLGLGCRDLRNYKLLCGEIVKFGIMKHGEPPNLISHWTLEVAGCSQLTDNGFQALARNCHNLERMDLEECVLITDTTLGHLAVHCPVLSKLSLSHCELITDEGIRHLGSSHCATDSLTVLELDNCPLITDASLEHLMGCHELERIELYDCQLITRAGIRRLRNHLPDVKIHAYFAPVTPPPSVGGGRQRYCRCCIII